MQSDIIERLLEVVTCGCDGDAASGTSKEAAAEIDRLRKELDETRANIKARDYRSFIAGWMRYDKSREVDLDRADHEFEQWYGERSAIIHALARGET